MRILFLVPYPPSLIRVRPYQLIRMLARRGHQLTVVSPWCSENEREELFRLAEQGVAIRTSRLPRWRTIWNCLRALPSNLPLQAAFSWEPGLMREAAAALEEETFDLVHVEHLRGALFGLKLVRSLRHENRPRKQGWSSPVVVWDSVDCISHLFEQAAEQSHSLQGRWMARLELGRTRRFEGWLAGQFDHVLVTSDTDRKALSRLRDGAAAKQQPGSRTPFSVVPNGVDLEYFTPSNHRRSPATLVFTGKMSYHANVTAAQYLVREVMPRVWKHDPKVKVILAGKNPPRSLQTLTSIRADRHQGTRVSSKDRGDSSVEVTGSLPDLRPCLRQATLSVVPIVYGAGIQNKVLEAMACATPVVATPAAVASLAARPGREVAVAGDADTFAREILELLNDDTRRQQLGNAGRRYVETHHDWDRIGRHLEDIYSGVIAARGLETAQFRDLPPIRIA